MSYCTQCGAYIPVGETACPACGHDPAAAQQQSGYSSWGGSGAAAQQQPQQNAHAQQQQASQQAQQQQQTEETRPASAWEPWKQPQSGGETDPRRLSVLSYVGPLFLLPLFLHKKDPFVRFHANQGLVLFLLECLIFGILGNGLLSLAGLIFCVYCVVRGARNVAEGKLAQLPLIGGIRLIK